MRMFRKAVLLGLLLLLVPVVGHAEKTIRVGVTPFAVHSQEDLGYLSQGLQEMVSGHLLQRGLDVVSEADMSGAMTRLALTRLDERAARVLGRTLNLDYVVIGSLTKLGRRISLDARIVDTLALKKTAAVFVQESELENLMAATEKLAREITVKISGRFKIASIAVSGNNRIEADAIKGVLQSREGDIFSEVRVSGDLKRVYDMNFFNDVKVDVEDSPEGKIVTFIVEEKPSIQAIELYGNKILADDELLEALGYALYSIVDPKKIVESVELLKNLYREDGYYNAEINYKIEELGPRKVSIRYDIREADRVYISLIDFEGNKAVSDDDLRDEMDTSEKGWFSWMTDSGILKRDELKNDISKLESFYFNHGFIEAKIGEPVIKVKAGGLVVTIPVEEGSQYKVGEVSISGDITVPEETVREKIMITKEEIYNRDIVRKDVRTITSLYADKGYAFAAVSPMIKVNRETLRVDIDYKVDKKRLVYFERISISGNTKTRDKVIRRELRVKEGDLFSATGLRHSHMNLQRLGFFDKVGMNNTKGSTEDKMNLDIVISERPTGAFSVGAGYSSFNDVFGLIRISQNNLFGKGQHLSVQATLGGRSNEYSLSFTEPWLYDIPLAVGFEIFNRDVDYDDYNKTSAGLILRAGYPIMDYVRLSGRYKYEEIEIGDVTEYASWHIKELEGESSTSSVTGMIKRDTRNRFFNPTRGSNNSFSVEYAGGALGGTNYFTRYVMNSGWFFPSFWKDHAFFIRGKFGYIAEREGGDLPAYEKFYLGGINTVRGFDWASISPTDPETGTKIGGEKMTLFNFEYIFPLAGESGLVAVLFFDQGNVWYEEDTWDITDLRQSYGAGVRYYSPLGPMRLEYGIVIDPKPGEPESNWEFSIGTFF